MVDVDTPTFQQVEVVGLAALDRRIVANRSHGFAAYDQDFQWRKRVPSQWKSMVKCSPLGLRTTVSSS